MAFASIMRASSSRASDRFGSGQFGASRGSRKHQGLDVKAKPGEVVHSPIDGVIVRECVPYAPFTGLLIRGTGEHSGYEVKLFYVQGNFCGSVKAGEPIGTAEDLAVKYPGITNHVHLEVRKNGAIVAPFDLFEMCF